MTHLILRTAGRFLIVLIGLFSLFMLLRGHNEPGGGFIGGLLLTGAFIAYALGHGIEATRELLRADPHTLIGLGLLVVFSSGCLALIGGKPFMTGQWLQQPIPGLGKVSSVLLFDVGVYLTVFGAIIHIIFTIAED